jgi:BirA family biotin operon repressor/biotin-[acetyl-CoA-carboxylase] ligase
VNGLKESGYQILAVQNRGYMLSKSSDVLSQQMIENYLKEVSDTTYAVSVFQEITSTNDVLKKLAVTEHVGEGTTIVSDYQTGGKGRLGRSFYSPKGTGLYLSMLLRPTGTVVDNLILTAQAAVAVYRAVKKTLGIELAIKWVNDLYLNGRKVCGILSEGQTSLESGHLEYVIVGIGVNLYEPEKGFPEEIRNRAGSILGRPSECREVDRNLLAAEIIREFYALAKEKQLASDYIERNMVPGHEILVIDGKGQRKAKALRIMPDGQLEIEEEDHSVHTLVYGEVSVRIKDDVRDIYC